MNLRGQRMGELLPGIEPSKIVRHYRETESRSFNTSIRGPFDALYFPIFPFFRRNDLLQQSVQKVNIREQMRRLVEIILLTWIKVFLV